MEEPAAKRPAIQKYVGYSHKFTLAEKQRLARGLRLAALEQRQQGCTLKCGDCSLTFCEACTVRPRARKCRIVLRDPELASLMSLQVSQVSHARKYRIVLPSQGAHRRMTHDVVLLQADARPDWPDLRAPPRSHKDPTQDAS